MLETLDASAVRGWCRSAAEALRRARSEIDALNVFPVADSDTGTNLHLTMEAVAEAAEGGEAVDPQSGQTDAACHSGDLAAHGEQTDLAEMWRAVARGALVGARGNSGVIVSQVWRGLAEVLPDANPCRGRALADGLRHAATLAYGAVARPVEGTVLTVVRAAGEASARTGTDDLAAVARAAAEGARGALGRTTGQLEALTRAGVVDAGGAGLCVILDALVGVVSDNRDHSSSVPPVPPADLCPVPDAQVLDFPVGRRDVEAAPAHEVMYLLDAGAEAASVLRGRLDELGESVLVVGGERLWNVHVHTEDAGAAIEAGLEVGRPHNIRVHYLRGTSNRTRGVVAVAGGEGVAALFAEAGAVALSPDADGSVAVADLLDGVRRAGREVAVLPNDGNLQAAAEAAAARARDEGCQVSVVPAKAVVQGLAGLAVHDPRRRFADDVVAMTAAAGATRAGQVSVAMGEAVTSAGVCAAGDVLGFVDSDIAVIGSDVVGVAVEVVERMLSAGGELVTLLTGAQLPTGAAEGVITHLRATRPDVDTATYAGGQSEAMLLVGVE